MSEPIGVSPGIRRGRVTAEQIASTAARLFASRGYYEVGMREIADELGIRGASLYHHYKSKEEVLYAICLRVTLEPAELQLPLLDATGTPTARLAALVRAHVLQLVDRQVEHLVGRHEMSALTDEHRAVIDEHRRYYHRRVKDTIAAGKRTGEFLVHDVGFATLALLDMLNGTSGWLHTEGPDTAAHVADAYVDLAVNGLLRGSLEAADATS